VPVRPGLAIAQGVGEKPAYSIEDLCRIGESRASAYRILGELREIGFAQQIREGWFTVRSSLFQPFSLWPSLFPSLQALKQMRFFGKSYNENDARNARNILKGDVTLDYGAYELTRLQLPRLLAVYVDNVDGAARALKDQGFSEGTRGRVVIMPQTGTIENMIERVYLDCIAFGGRSMLDAIGIEILHGGQIDPSVRGLFRTEDVLKVSDEIAAQSVARSH